MNNKNITGRYALPRSYQFTKVHVLLTNDKLVQPKSLRMYVIKLSLSATELTLFLAMGSEANKQALRDFL